MEHAMAKASMPRSETDLCSGASQSGAVGSLAFMDDVGSGSALWAASKSKPSCPMELVAFVVCVLVDLEGIDILACVSHVF